MEACSEAGSSSTVPTVESAIAAYAAVRKAKSLREGKNAEGRLARHVLSDKKFADRTLSKLRASDIEEWRGRLKVHSPDPDEDTEDSETGSIAPTTLNRLLNDLRAALNAAAEKHRRELPSHLVGEIKTGTKAVAADSNARKQILTDQQIRVAIAAAFEVDADFGRLALLLGSTGARHSQARRLRVRDVQIDQQRIMMPGSRKGRSGKPRPPVAVSVSPGVIEQLGPSIKGRDPDAPLLERWYYRRAGALKWQKDVRGPWGTADEADKFWSATIVSAGLPADSVLYAFRHSSIVRGLKAGLPIRLVAASHDTSSEMIEKHYSAYIVDATEELSRRAAMIF